MTALKIIQQRWVPPKALIATAVASALAAIAPIANADVILIGPTQIQPAGIGTVSSLLSLQSQGNATDETGSVSWNGTTSVVTPGANTIVTGGANNTTRTFSEIGLTSAADLRVFLNINETSPNPDVLLRSLVFNVYSPTGTVVFTGALAGSVSLNQIQSGIGLAGYAFGLDTTQAAALQGVFSPTLRLGISADIGNAQGGFENFFVGRAAQVVPPDQIPDTVKVPEPATLGLLGLGLVGLAAMRRRRQS